MDIDKELKKMKYEDIKAPEEFEAIAKKAIDNANKEKNYNKSHKRYIQVAIIALLFLITLSSKEVIAYIYDKIVGYNQFFSYNSYIEELNEEGKIQIINKEIVFENGEKINVEGLIYDGKYLSLFYKVPSSNKIEKDFIDNITIDEAVRDVSYSEENDENGNKLYVYEFNTIEYKENINFKIEVNGEVKNLEVEIDKSKVIESKNIKPKDNEIIIDDVKITINNIRVAANSITLDYNVTSENKILANKIKNSEGNLYKERIDINFIIKGRRLNPVGYAKIPEENKVIENGLSISELIYIQDLRTDKMNYIDIIINSLNYTSTIKLDKLKEKTWFNKDLYIYEIDKDKNEITYFVRKSKPKNTMPKYQLGATSVIYLPDSEINIKAKEALGKDYKNFDLMKDRIDSMKEGEIVLVENKVTDIKDKERTFKIKLK